MLAVLLSGVCSGPATRTDALVLTRPDDTKLELKGRDDAVVLAFVSRRSPPCRPLLDELARITPAASGVRLVAVVVDRNPEPADAALPGFEVVLDPEKSAAERYQVSVLPTVVVLDRRLNVRRREEGFSPRTADRLAAALAPPAAGD